jgi:hypothetical protein
MGYYDPPEEPLSAIEIIDDWQYKNKITDDELWAIFEMGKAALSALREGIELPDIRWKPDLEPGPEDYERFDWSEMEQDTQE